MSTLRFSGHDTFHCREQWLLKGVQLFNKQGDISYFRQNEAIPDLGVGKNMVRSILHWMKAFNVYNDKENRLGELSEILFSSLSLDPYLENEGSIWLMQYYLCSTEYASIFKYIFCDYFSDKATLEFSESQIKSFLKRCLEELDQKAITDKTLGSDFKVFIKTYVLPKKNSKTVEDDFSAPLLSLNLVIDTGKRNDFNEHIYRINKAKQEELSVEVFGYCMLSYFKDELTINFDKLRITLGAFMCLSNEGLELIVEKLCSSYSEFVYKDDAGIRQIQFKNIPKDFKINLLKKHYELYS